MLGTRLNRSRGSAAREFMHGGTERQTGRDKMLQDVALQRTSVETARDGLEMLAWADSALYHAWRLVESLRVAAGR